MTQFFFAEGAEDQVWEAELAGGEEDLQRFVRQADQNTEEYGKQQTVLLLLKHAAEGEAKEEVLGDMGGVAELLPVGDPGGGSPVREQTE